MSPVAERVRDEDVLQVVGDLDDFAFEAISRPGRLAWDIETTGLDWQSDELCTVQIYNTETGALALVRDVRPTPDRLMHLLADPDRPKVFHHAMFDLRFMAASWGVVPANIACTKIAAKLLRLPQREQSLAPLLNNLLGVSLDKSQQRSDWGVDDLSPEQVRYAAADVYYLGELLSALSARLITEGLQELAEVCFGHIPTRVALELDGYPDVFVY